MRLTLRQFNALFPDEDAARGWFKRARWPQGPVCNGCGSVNDAIWFKKSCRWNRKRNDVLARIEAMVRNGEGRLLSYAFLTREPRPA